MKNIMGREERRVKRDCDPDHFRTNWKLKHVIERLSINHLSRKPVLVFDRSQEFFFISIMKCLLQSFALCQYPCLWWSAIKTWHCSLHLPFFVLAHVQFPIHQYYQGLFSRAVLHPAACTGSGGCHDSGVDFVLGLFEPQEVLLESLTLFGSLWLASHALGMSTAPHSLVS